MLKPNHPQCIEISILKYIHTEVLTNTCSYSPLLITIFIALTAPLLAFMRNSLKSGVAGFSREV